MSKNRELMTLLAETFPSLNREFAGDVPGVAPWDPVLLDAWAFDGGHGSGSVHAVRFLLGLWNGHVAWQCPSFDVFGAFACWDAEHRAAFLSWANASPIFWP